MTTRPSFNMGPEAADSDYSITQQVIIDLCNYMIVIQNIKLVIDSKLEEAVYDSSCYSDFSSEEVSYEEQDYRTEAGNLTTFNHVKWTKIRKTKSYEEENEYNLQLS